MSIRGGGFSLPEAVVVVAIVALSVALALPRAMSARGVLAAAAAGRELTVLLNGVRWSAVANASSHGLLFSLDTTGWSWTTVKDGNGNGLRTREVRAGKDPTLERAIRLEDLVPGVRLGFPGPGPYPRVPPSRGKVEVIDGPVRLGNTGLLAYSPLGSSSSGALYVTDGARLYALVVYGRTGRTRLWRFIEESGTWRR